MGAIVDVTSATFARNVLESSQPVLVDFWSAHCQPCKVIEPILEEIARDREPQLKIVRLDSEAAPDLTRTYSVMSAPTLLLFVDGEPVKRVVGVRGKQHLLAELDPFLG